MHIWSETPVADIWQQLRYFKPAVNVRNLLTGRTASHRTNVWPDDIATSHRAHEVASCVEQADEYFTSSRSVSLATKPLMQFYGVQSLAKAAILATNQEASLAQLSYHGLSTRATSAAHASERRACEDYSSNQDVWLIEKEFAVTNDGVFPFLARINTEIAVVPGRVLTFGELIQMVPELSAPLPVLFALAFIMSNVVRYKPAFWMNVLQGDSSGAAAIVESVCSVIERRFAHDALETLWGERFSFGSPGYLG